MNLLKQFSWDPEAKKLSFFVILIALSIAGAVFLRGFTGFRFLNKVLPLSQEEQLKQHYAAVVKIENNRFIPNQIQIKPGDEVAFFTVEQKKYNLFSSRNSVLPVSVVDGANKKIFVFRPELPLNFTALTAPFANIISLRPFNAGSLANLSKGIPPFMLVIIIKQ
ncbi:hypothetical protein KGQ34_00110 [Patescibacteria group bacterium]|nr:hypothetical protein [Patescibacteria group bacterium]